MKTSAINILCGSGVTKDYLRHVSMFKGWWVSWDWVLSHIGNLKLKWILSSCHTYLKCKYVGT